MSLFLRCAALSLMLASLPVVAAPAVIPTLHAQFLPADDLQLRAEQPEAGGLVIATDQDHARGIVALLRDRKGQYRLHHPVDRTEVTVSRNRVREFKERLGI